jgi:hypothetical protein
MEVGRCNQLTDNRQLWPDERVQRPQLDEDVRLIISLLRSLKRKNEGKYREAVTLEKDGVVV